MSGQNHIIHKLVLDVDVKDERKAYQIKDHISGFLEGNFLPLLEKRLDEWGGVNQILRFDRLVLDVRVDSWEKSDQLINKIEDELRKKIQRDYSFGLNGTPKLIRPENAGFDDEENVSETVPYEIESAESRKQIFLAFIETGILPWYGRKEQIIKLLKSANWKKSLNDKVFVESLIKAISQNENALHRFIWQVPVPNLLDVLFTKKVLRTDSKSELLKALKKTSPDFTESLIRFAFNSISKDGKTLEKDINELFYNYKKDSYPSQKTSKNGFLNWMQSHFSEVPIQEIEKYLNEEKKESLFNKQNLIVKPERGHFETKTEKFLENNPTIISGNNFRSVREKESLRQNESQEWSIQNAGQILFHPFLKFFFQRFDWLNEHDLLLPEHKMKAVQALHYSVTGTTDFFEADMILEKFLCGIPFEEPVLSESLLSGKIKREATFMVKEVIRNWPELKSTSPAGLRELFIQRDGKLFKSDSGYQLIVERKTQDILLEKLSWNISIIKMPWQKELLFVEW